MDHSTKTRHRKRLIANGYTETRIPGGRILWQRQGDCLTVIRYRDLAEKQVDLTGMGNARALPDPESHVENEAWACQVAHDEGYMWQGVGA